MTEREAFEKWYTDSLCNLELSSFAHKVWQAACKYQREKDADLADLHCDDARDEILNQEGSA